MTRVSYSDNRLDDDRYLHSTIRRSAKPLSMLGNRKFKAKEERKRVLKLSVQKLKDIEDPETFLRRSVLINNTMKRLQTEVRQEKSYKHKKNFFYERLLSQDTSSQNPSTPSSDPSTPSPHPSSSSSEEEEEEEEDEEFQVEVEEERKGEEEEEEIIDVSSPAEGESDSDLLLREVYMPPPISPPSMISSMEEDAEERHRIDKRWYEPVSPSSPSYSPSSLEQISNSIPSASNAASYLPDKNITCGQSSLFGELQTVVFNSLIASLET